MTLTLLIPIFGISEDPDRQKSFEFVLDRLHASKVKDVLIVEQLAKGQKPIYLPSWVRYVSVQSDNQSIHKTRLCNIAVSQHTKSDYVWIHDADCYVRFDDALKQIQGQNLIKPFSKIYRLDERQTNEFMVKGKTHLKKAPYVNTLCGGSIIIKRDLYLAVRGFNEGISTWGAEDTELGDRLRKITTADEIKIKGIHLYHERDRKQLKRTARGNIRHVTATRSMDIHSAVERIGSSIPYDADALSKYAHKDLSQEPKSLLPDTAIIMGYYGDSELRRDAVSQSINYLSYQDPQPLMVMVEIGSREFEYLDRGDGWRYIHLDGDDRSNGAWQKEAIYNLATKAIGDQYKYLIYHDPDMYPDPESDHPNRWASRVRERLMEQPDKILQPYAEWTDAEDVKYNHFPGYVYGKTQNKNGSPGGSWAMTKDVYDAIGGFDHRAFAGGGDGLFLLTHEADCKYSSDHMRWDYYADLVKSYNGPKYQLGYLDQHLIHSYHGPHHATTPTEGQRAYHWRNAVIQWDGRSADEIIELGDDGLIRYREAQDPLQYCMLHKSEMVSEATARDVFKDGQQTHKTFNLPTYKYDQVWWISHPIGGMGSAMRGAINILRDRGLKIKEVNKGDAVNVTDAPHWVLGGIPMDLYRQLKSQDPDLKITLQDHSPWMYLANARHDFEYYMEALNACKMDDGKTKIAHVAEREYLDASRAFGEQYIDLIPAIYEGPIQEDIGETGGPIILAHCDRPGKNLMGQLVAGAIVARDLDLPLVWHVPKGVEQKTRDMVKTIEDLYQINVVKYEWHTQDQFRIFCRTASVGLCATWTDAYSQVACDFLAQGTPILASHSQWFCPDDWCPNPDDIPQMVKTIKTLTRGKTKRQKAIEIIKDAQKIQTDHLIKWMEAL